MDAQSEGETTASWSKESNWRGRVNFSREFFDENGTHVLERKTLQPSGASGRYVRIETDNEGIKREFGIFPEGSTDLDSARSIKVEIPLVYNNDIFVDLNAIYFDSSCYLRQDIHLENSEVGDILPRVAATYSDTSGELEQLMIKVGNPSQFFDEFFEHEIELLDKSYKTPRIEYLHRLHDFYGDEFSHRKDRFLPEEEEAIKKELADESVPKIQEKLLSQVKEVFSGYSDEKIDEIVASMMHNAALLSVRHKVSYSEVDEGENMLDLMVDRLVYFTYMNHEEKLGEPTQYTIELSPNQGKNAWIMKIVEYSKIEDLDDEPKVTMQDEIHLGEEKQYEDIVFTLNHTDGRLLLKLGRFKMGGDAESVELDFQDKLDVEALKETLRGEFPSMRESLQLIDTRVNKEPLVTAA